MQTPTEFLKCVLGLYRKPCYAADFVAMAQVFSRSLVSSGTRQADECVTGDSYAAVESACEALS